MHIRRSAPLNPNNMKRIPFFLIFFALPFLAHAQFEGTVRAGMNLSDWSIAASSYAKPGVTAGLTGGYTWNNRWNLQSGLLFSTRGINGLAIVLPESDRLATVDYNLFYLKIPLAVRYRIPVTESVRILPGFGPYFACGVGGNGNLNGFNLPGDGSSWNPFRSGELPDPGFRALDRFDWGLQFQLTAQVCRWDLTVSYELGLYENSTGPVLSDNWRTRTFSITLGYTFGK